MAFALTLSELARWVDGDIVRGGLDLSLTGMAALDAASPHDVSFLGNEKYYGQFLETKAAAVIVPRGVTSGPEGTALIAVENPSLAFAVVVRHFAAAVRKFAPGVHPRAFVDPSAVFDPAKVRIQAGAVVLAGVTIGDGSDIGPNSVISDDAVIGRDCRLMANSSVRERCVLGDRVILQPGAVIGSDGYGYEFSEGRHMKIDQVGIVEIGDDVEIGANTSIDRARFGKTIIGEGTKIDNLVQIGHNVVIGKHCLVVSQTGISGSTKLGDYVTCAGQVGIVGHVTIGDKVTLTARTGVTTDLAAGQIYSGKPARPMREAMKIEAYSRRLPKLIDRVKALEKALGDTVAERE
ncbi:UDP-3-O-(3-hydroxymyristoyl)glucosamine N-acyltransferase [Luteolibacter yonseiensis]|uniref:UDP-3-O-acylglucosamine N-acyltransferase n=1 Tax=Luteolibacter yonseiensis TaxID=1144680 RepID=A0A934V923_9BACT|nr:UDP-3-O-(3-hydroxymyristoyl)glucosamine N-acyltransferase [Luteolibacter yonseiensis]MBK1814718.1 UDP-3-O-(3-hydroxymyristoyl)glucosamine N-acyltransferase [Luteolibacter yonseiensis]